LEYDMDVWYGLPFIVPSLPYFRANLHEYKMNSSCSVRV
jgi:hypothetical protein